MPAADRRRAFLNVPSDHASASAVAVGSITPASKNPD